MKSQLLQKSTLEEIMITHRMIVVKNSNSSIDFFVMIECYRPINSLIYIEINGYIELFNKY